MLSLFALAATLAPNTSGMGTHEQLGLPACGVVRMWGIRCPTCGMTTAWAHTAKGQLRQALAANVAGTLLATLALPTAGWLIASGSIGQWCYLRPQANLIFLLVATVVCLALFEWIVRVLPGMVN